MQNLFDPRTPVPGSRVPRPPVLKALTSVRFFAAMLVALYHLVRPFSLWGYIAPVIGAGYVGVSFFFFLSGFILTYSHAAEYELGNGSAARFWVARFARIYPVYLLTMIFAGYTGFSLFRQHIHILAYLADLLMVQSWSVRVVNFFHVTAWSLSVEMFFYLVFPFLLMRLRPPTRLRAVLAITAFWLFAMIPPILCVAFDPLGSWTEGPPQAINTFRVLRLPIFALPEFLAGVSLGWLYLRFPPSRKVAACFAPIGFVAFGIGLSFSHHVPKLLIHNGIFIPFYSLIILGLCEKNWLSAQLSASWIVLLGEASYALYLVHFLFNDWTKDTFGAGSGMTSALWKLAVLIPLSIALHLYVERPGRKAILKWRQRRRAN